MIPFRVVAMILAVLFVALFVVLAFFGTAYMRTYGVAATPASEFMALRAAPMFLGLAVMFWMLRNVSAGPVRGAVCTGTAVLFAGIAVTGIYEFARGFASFNILIAAVAELVAAAILWRYRR